jgi:hypothetical protein
MHVSHIIAIEADDYDEAVSSVDYYLNGGWEGVNNFPWSDWSKVGGRWVDEFGEGKPALCYTDDPDRFNSCVKMMVGKREEQLDEHLRMVKKSGLDLDKIREKGKEDHYANGVWSLGKAMSIILGDSASDAYFYDLVDYTEDDSYLQERIKSDPSHQWIVVVDFHF